MLARHDANDTKSDIATVVFYKIIMCGYSVGASKHNGVYNFLRGPWSAYLSILDYLLYIMWDPVGAGFI